MSCQVAAQSCVCFETGTTDVTYFGGHMLAFVLLQMEHVDECFTTQVAVHRLMCGVVNADVL